MSGIGSGYDLSATTFSPDGRVFQVEYAAKAVESGGTTLGVRCKDGVVFATEKIRLSKMLVKGTGRRVHTVDRGIGMADCGLIADGRQIASRARSECENYRSFYGVPIPPSILCERVASYMHLFTLYWHVRPFGSAVLLGSYDKQSGGQIYLCEPSGEANRYFACAIGKGRQSAKTDLEKLNPHNLTCREVLVELAKIIRAARGEGTEKDVELQMSWICDESDCKHVLVPDDLVEQADTQAKQAAEDDDMED